MATFEEGSSPLSDRELLLLVNERLTTLNTKFDELRADNITKYEFLRDELKCFKDQYQNDMYRINRKQSMQDGAVAITYGILLILSGVITYLVTK